MQQYGEDLSKMARSAPPEKQLQLEEYDFHCDAEFLTDLKIKGKLITMLFQTNAQTS